MSVGSITYSGKTITLLSALTASGTFDDEPVAQAEELITPGINGRRWRTLFRQFPSFQMTTVSEAATYAGAQIIKATAEQFTQKLVNLTVTIDGITFNMQDVHVSAALCRLFPGPVYGAGASASNAAHIEIAWQLELTDFESV